MKLKKLFLLALCSFSVKAEVTAPAPVLPVPSAKQVAWQKMETYAFIHFGLNTFNDAEWGYGNVDMQTFNPKKLNCEQWVRILKAAGMKGVIITAKHHDGFCLWPTRATEYCVRNTPFRDGKGDVVGELAAACRKYGLKMGVYLSPWDRNHANYGRQDYVNYYHSQLKELLTNYGDIFEVWLDGANGGDGWYGGANERRSIDSRTYYQFDKIYEIVDSLQPNAVIFSNSGPGCRWVGNENGFADATCWSMIPSNTIYPGYPHPEKLQTGFPDGDQWTAAECDVSIRPGWFYHKNQDDKVKTVEQLTDIYYRSVGHNATFLLNVPVDTDGLIHPNDSTNLMNFHERITKELAHNLLDGITPKVSVTRGGKFGAKAICDGNDDTYWAAPDGVTKATIVFKMPKATTISHLMLQEYIPLGQRVSKFSVEYLDGKTWKTLNVGEETTTIGYKRLLRFSPITTKGLRITILESRACPCISNIAAY